MRRPADDDEPQFWLKLQLWLQFEPRASVVTEVQVQALAENSLAKKFYKLFLAKHVP